MADYACPICTCSFLNVPEKELFDIGCKCKDSKYHSGCLLQIYNHLHENNKTEYICPSCRSYSIEIKHIKNFLHSIAGDNGINKTNYWQRFRLGIKNFFEQLENHWTYPFKTINIIYVIVMIVMIGYGTYTIIYKINIYSNRLYDKCIEPLGPFNLNVNGDAYNACNKKIKNSTTFKLDIFMTILWIKIVTILVLFGIKYISTIFKTIYIIGVLAQISVMHYFINNPYFETGYGAADVLCLLLFVFICSWIIKSIIEMLIDIVIIDNYQFDESKFKDGYEYDSSIEFTENNTDHIEITMTHEPCPEGFQNEVTEIDPNFTFSSFQQTQSVLETIQLPLNN
jgi:hypothetical protein